MRGDGKCIGLTVSQRGPCIKVDGAKHRRIITAAARVLDEGGALTEDFTFTSIQVGVNSTSGRHCDRNNLGPSIIIGLGDFTGGSFVDASGHHHDLRGKGRLFDGTQPHESTEFRGHRVSVVLFTYNAVSRIGTQMLQALENIGFRPRASGRRPAKAPRTTSNDPPPRTQTQSGGSPADRPRHTAGPIGAAGGPAAQPTETPTLAAYDPGRVHYVLTGEWGEVVLPQDAYFVVVGYFSGLAPEHVSLDLYLGIHPDLAIAVEDNPECKAVVARHFPDIIVLDDADKATASVIIEILKSKNVPPGAIILLSAGPPCPDYSIIRGDRAQGRTGPEGRKFVDFCKTARELKATSPWRVELLIENVVPMNPEDAKFFDKELGVQGIVVDPWPELGPYGRRRIWWQSFIKQDMTAIPWGDHSIPLKWRRERGYTQLTPCADRLEAHSLSWNGEWALHESVRTGQRRVPCFSTPAPDDKGRPPPRGAESLDTVSPEAIERWLAQGREYAPWQYEDVALLWRLNTSPASREQDWLVMPPVVREVLHHFPPGYTAVSVDGEGLWPPAKSRARMVANSWHLGVTTFLLRAFLVIALGATPATSFAPPPAEPPDGLVSQELIPVRLSPGGESYLDSLALMIRAAGVTYGP